MAQMALLIRQIYNRTIRLRHTANTYLVFTPTDLSVDFFDKPNLLADPSYDPPR
jgi:hypothetical protein